MPIQTPAPKAVQSLPEPVAQSQERIQAEHPMPFQTPVSQPTGPTSTTQPIGPKIEHKTIPFYCDLILRLPPRPPDSNDTRKIYWTWDTDRNIDFEENSLYQEGIISETYERPDKSYFKEPSELKDLIGSTKLVQKFLPKQTDIDKFLNVIKRKVLKGAHLPLTIKEIQAGYLTSPYFKDLYLYLAQNRLPSKRSAIHNVETLAERFILLDSLLFKLVTMPEKETVLLAVPQVCANKIITLYHTSHFAGHQGVIKTYLTINDNFFHSRSYALFEIIHKRVSYMSVSKSRQTAYETITN